MLARLSVTLLRHIGSSPKWVLLLLRLCAFATALLPAFLTVCWRSRTYLRASAAYGPHMRQTMDVYMPEAHALKQPLGLCIAPPVCVYICGGAWTIGYKKWAIAHACALARLGVVVVVADYRNFPQATISGMLSDVRAAVAASVRVPEIVASGADTSRVWLIGQSAGAHMCATILAQDFTSARPAAQLQQHACTDDDDDEDEVVARGGSRDVCDDLCACGRPRAPPALPLLGVLEPFIRSPRVPDAAHAPPPRVQRFIGVSGAYELEPLVTHMQSRAGIGASFMHSIFEGNLQRFSPVTLLGASRGGGEGGAGEMPVECGVHPPVTLLHGTCDTAVSHTSSLAYAAALTSAGVRAEAHMLEGATHTDPVLEHVFTGQDVLTHMVVRCIQQDVHADSVAAMHDEGASVMGVRLRGDVMLSRGLAACARWLSPF